MVVPGPNHDTHCLHLQLANDQQAWYLAAREWPLLSVGTEYIVCRSTEYDVGMYVHMVCTKYVNTLYTVRHTVQELAGGFPYVHLHHYFHPVLVFVLYEVRSIYFVISRINLLARSTLQELLRRTKC